MVKVQVVAALVAALAIAGCAGSDGSVDDGSGSTADSTEALRAGRKLSEAEVADALRQAGFAEEDVPAMVCTAKYESSFYERAMNNHNRNGSIDRGLFQINSVHLGRRGCPKTGEGLYSAAANAKCALVIYNEQSNTAWYGYKKHRAECDSYVVEE
jgi:hypothetical protein